ncbi:MAG: phosphoglycerate kinase [Candidatus Woesebacteria bacterium]|nr:phosphoglycerate kinase [Candidatus Woesebacteria bacterium]
MLNLPKLTDLDISNKKVILRLDLDLKEFDPNDLRIRASIKTLDFLKEKNCQIIIIAHRGRPDGKFDETLSFKEFRSYFNKWNAKVEENLRFDKGEEENNLEFAKKLATLGEVFINEAFASSHRNHASIVSLPKLLPHVFGFRFIEEVENLSKVFDNPKKPVVTLLSGLKEDKLKYLDGLEAISDKVLVGGRLPDLLGDNTLSVRNQEGKVIIGNLVMDKEDITVNTIERFEKEIIGAGTILLSGPLGKFEEEGHRQGTERIFKAISALPSFKVAGGGETEKAINLLKISDKFNWISVGGGAFLEFLVNKTLPGIKAFDN